MYPAAFDYLSPATWDDAVAALVEHGPEAKVLAGGCSLIPIFKLRMAEPRVLIDLGRIGARDVVDDGNVLRLGAMVRESTIEEPSGPVHRRCPLLAETSAVIADPIVRNMGTVGGNLAHADPANDHPAAMLALGAQVVARGPRGERVIGIDDFFVDLYLTALEPDELLTEIRVPTDGTGTGGAYEKFERQVGDFPIVAVAARLTVADGVITDARIGLTNVGPTAIRARDAEGELIGRPASVRTISRAADATGAAIEPWSELRGSASFKRATLPTIAARAIGRAVERATGGRGSQGGA
jgi:carbon-monoxide dehydrogenase medium subunit